MNSFLNKHFNFQKVEKYTIILSSSSHFVLKKYARFSLQAPPKNGA
jgi:hypothetical protein